MELIKDQVDSGQTTPERKQEAVAIDLGLRYEVPGCDGRLIGALCFTDINSGMWFVHERDVKRGSRVTCPTCEDSHYLLTLPEAIELGWATGGEEFGATVSCEDLLLNEITIRKRAAERAREESGAARKTGAA